MASATEALSDAVLAIAAEHAVEPVLQKLVDAARELAGARYAAIGVPDGDGGFARFITSGMSDRLIASLGELPRTHGLLGAMLESPQPYRTHDIRQDERFRGWWPAAHPSMASFLGVPIVSRGAIVGAFYLTDKESAATFSDGDQALIETFAAHAALALENARLHERSRELSIVEERNRLARELHDAVTQKLFGVVLAAESGAALLERDVDQAGAQLALVRDLAREARCARSSSTCAPRRSTPRGSRSRSPSTSTCCAARTGERSSWRSTARRRSRRRSRPTSSASPRRRCTTRCATRRPRTSRCACAASRAACSSASATTASASSAARCARAASA